MPSIITDTSYTTYKQALKADTTPPPIFNWHDFSGPTFPTGNEYLLSSNDFHKVIGMRHHLETEFLNPGSDPRFEAELQESLDNQSDEDVESLLERGIFRAQGMIKECTRVLGDGDVWLRKRRNSRKCSLNRGRRLSRRSSLVGGVKGFVNLIEHSDQTVAAPETSKAKDPDKRHSVLIQNIFELLDDDDVKDGLATENVRRELADAMQTPFEG